ncbi:uncharacterized protein with NAD-binding domain and iron-sulfur cluster [Rhodococcus sp. 27YEA15]|uniref:hydroxysqualene dehydroxylase n=1 Tax=Rhodococcus sp. 27YEA15 TaxID=3156259 RepID=UPI003C7DFB42
MNSIQSPGVSRRTLLSGAAGAFAVAAALGRPAGATPSSRWSGADRRTPGLRTTGRRVAVLGGGVGGLTAAHELAERGFDVTVYEPTALGGKARSMPFPGTGTEGRLDLPGEHGFRFFPGFYQHIPDTMRRIPVPGNPNGVLDNLAVGAAIRLSMPGADFAAPANLVKPDFTSFDLASLQQSLVSLTNVGTSIPPEELLLFNRKLAMFLTSCMGRRETQWENQTWSQTMEAEGKSKTYQDILINALTRQLVAARPDVVSTRTIGLIGQAFLWNSVEAVPQYGHTDRLLSAPTNEAWIDPWEVFLRSLGVKFQMGWRTEALDVSGGVVSGARVVDGQGRRATVDADWYVAAMPVERATPLLTGQILNLDPSLESIGNLHTDWMVGIQYYLRNPIEIAAGHVAYVSTPWALTSINQAQFWRKNFATEYGDGTARDCLSVDISDWDTPGILTGKRAKDCTAEEIAREVWAQLAQNLNDYGEPLLDYDNVISWFLDPGIQWNGTHNTNDTPLLINTVGSWAHRPEARTAIPNFVLASDYVRTDINLATMESANEAARSAVDAILDASDSSASPCTKYTLYEPPELAPLRKIDEDRYAAGLPHLLDG